MLQRGQISSAWLIGTGISVAIFFAGALLTQSNIFNSKVDIVKTDLSDSKTEIGKDISRLTAESEQYRRDITDINKKLDTILNKLK